jgi:hypothetical protein
MRLRSVAAAMVYAFCADATANDIAADLARCRSESDDARRLQCYDSLAKGDTPAALKIPPKMSQEEFGVSNGPIAAQKSKSQPQLQEIVAKAVEVKKKANGELVVTLDNDQVWQQLQPSNLRLRVGDEVIIKAGALGSFILVAPSGRGTKVQRVK